MLNPLSLICQTTSREIHTSLFFSSQITYTIAYIYNILIYIYIFISLNYHILLNQLNSSFKSDKLHKSDCNLLLNSLPRADSDPADQTSGARRLSGKRRRTEGSAATAMQGEEAEPGELLRHWVSTRMTYSIL